MQLIYRLDRKYKFIILRDCITTTVKLASYDYKHVHSIIIIIMSTPTGQKKAIASYNHIIIACPKSFIQIALMFMTLFNTMSCVYKRTLITQTHSCRCIMNQKNSYIHLNLVLPPGCTKFLLKA